MQSANKSWQDGRKVLDILARGPLLPLDAEAIERLIRRADLSVLDREGNTSLIRAAMNKTCSLQLFSNLIAAGAPVSAVNFSGFTALSQASSLCRLEFVVMLLSHRADPNTSSTKLCATPLIQASNCDAASSSQSAAVACALLRAGAHPFALNSCRKSALIIAAELKRDDVVGVLLDSCTTPNTPHCANSVAQLLQHISISDARTFIDPSAARTRTLMLSAEVAQVYVACCRHMVSTRASSSALTSIGPLLPLPVQFRPQFHSTAGDTQLPSTPSLVSPQLVRLLASAGTLAFFLMCRLSCGTFYTSPSHPISKRMRRCLLMRVCNARLPYLIALLQSPAVATAAAVAARAVAFAARSVEAAKSEQRSKEKGRMKKKRGRECAMRTPKR